MAKQRPEQPPPERSALIPAVDRVQALVQAHPDAISYDPTLPENELLHIQTMTDPGIMAQARDGWRGYVNGWAVGTWEATDAATGEVMLLPSLCLLTVGGELVRLTGWPAISSWSAIIRVAGADRVRKGLPVKVTRRASGTAGRSYWCVQVDAAQQQ